MVGIFGNIRLVFVNVKSRRCSDAESKEGAGRV
jgi:hypothetical protein